MKFNSFYVNRPEPVFTVPDTETKFVDQSEADRASLKFQLERYGMDSLLQQLENTKAQFGYADTRMCADFAELQQKMAEANSYFMKLPSRVRAKFNHDATTFYSSIEANPEKAFDDGYISKDLAAKMGVLKCIEKPVDSSSLVNEGPTSTTVVNDVKSDVVGSDTNNESA